MLVVFDWDGTILDSAPKIVCSMQSAAQALGLSACSDESIRAIIGLGLPEAIRELYPDLSDTGVDALKQEYSHHFVALDQEPSPYFPDVVEVLEYLKQGGVRLAVATGKSRRGLDRAFAALPIRTLFDASRCADETCSKPHPLMLQQLMEELAVKPEQAWMVGDTEFDLEMARRAGVRGVGVTYGVHSVERMSRAAPHALIDRMSELPALLGL